VSVFTNHLILTTSEKGGSGKSTAAIALVDALRFEGIPLAAYDGNVDVSSLYETLGTRDATGQLTDAQDPLMGAFPYSVRDESRTVLVDCLRQGYAHMVHDIAGGGLTDMQRLFGDKPDSLYQFVRSIARFDTCAVFVHLLTPDISTVASVAKYLDITENLGDLGHHVRHIAMLNLQGNRSEAHFPHWYGYTDATGEEKGGKTRARLLAAGGAEMNLPAIDERTMALLKAQKVPFTVGANMPEMSITDQSRLYNFTEDFSKELTHEIRQILGLAQ
jgi:hypothetical protein